MPNLKGFDKVNNNLSRVWNGTIDAAKVSLQLTAAQTVIYAKHHAPWRDRTGNARKSIHHETSSDGMKVSIGIGMPYGKYLELSRGGKYRIIDPAVFSFGKIQMKENLKGILRNGRQRS